MYAFFPWRCPPPLPPSGAARGSRLVHPRRPRRAAGRPKWGCKEDFGQDDLLALALAAVVVAPCRRERR